MFLGPTIIEAQEPGKQLGLPPHRKVWIRRY